MSALVMFGLDQYLRGMKKIVALILTAFILAPTAAVAMGSGDKFSDAQTGLTYSVYKPTKTLGMAAVTFSLLPCQPGKEEWIYLKYGGSKRYIEIMETMGGVKCSNPGLSKYLRTVVVNGAKAKVYVYCDPTKPASYKKCTVLDIGRVGGYLMFMTKAVKPFKKTEIQVQGIGGVTYLQLLAIARGLKRVSASGNTFSQVVAPVMLDPLTTAEVSVRAGNTVVLTVSDPDNWSGAVKDSKIAEFIAGGNQGSYVSNPGIKALTLGKTTVHLVHGNDSFELELTVTP